MRRLCVLLAFLLLSSSFVFARGSKVDAYPFGEEHTVVYTGRANVNVENQSGGTDLYDQKVTLYYDDRIFEDPENSSAGLEKDKDYTYTDGFTIKFTSSGEEKIKKNSFYVLKDGKLSLLSELGEKEQKIYGNVVEKVLSSVSERKDKQLGQWENAILQQMQKADDIFVKFNSLLKISYVSFAKGESTPSSYEEDMLDVSSFSSVERNMSVLTGSGSGHTLDEGKKYMTYILFFLLFLEVAVIALHSFLKGTVPLAELVLKLLLCVFLMFMITNIWNIMSVASSVFIRGGEVAAATTQLSNPDEYKADETSGFEDGMFKNAYKSYVEDFDKRNEGEVVIRPSKVLNMSYTIQRQLRLAEDYAKEELGSSLNFKFVKKLLIWIAFLIVRVIMLLIFTLITLYIMLWQIELRILIIIATFLLPFKMFRYTDFLAKGIWSTLLGQCVKLFSASYLINISSFILQGTVEELFSEMNTESYDFPKIMIVLVPLLLLVVCLLAYFILKVPETARAILVGQPTTDGNMHSAATRLAAKGAAVPHAAASVVNRPLKGGKILGDALADAKKEGGIGWLTATGGGMGTLLAYGGLKLGKKVFGGKNSPGGAPVPKMDGATSEV